MDWSAAEKIANAVLYEGYMLYPYRRSSTKNQKRWNFGTLYPPGYAEVLAGAERSAMHIECLLAGDAPVQALARFLQPGAGAELSERSAEFEFRPGAAPQQWTFPLPSDTGEQLHLAIFAAAEPGGAGIWKLAIDLSNRTPGGTADRDTAMLRSLVSLHVILCAPRANFVSLLDPPQELSDQAAACRNLGCFPVLVGDPNARDMMLCSPIILYDYPQIAPESSGDFFDGTEIDEMLTLRISTLTDAEKDEMRHGDDRVRTLLERTEAGAREQLMRTHGTIRGLRPARDDHG